MESSPPESSHPGSSSASLRASKRRSRATSESIAEILALPDAGERQELPESLADLGKALDRALHSDGDVNLAYGNFADRAFADAATAQVASRYVTNLFVGQQGALANLTRTKDLLTALENGSNELTRFVAHRWQTEGMTQRISRFAESLILNKDSLQNPAAAEIMVAFAGLLAPNKPDRAASLMKLANEIAASPGGKELAEDIHSQIAAGALIEPLPADARAFWQQYLRNPITDWSSPEAEAAMRTLAPLLSQNGPAAALFEGIIPEVVWKKFCESEASPPEPAPPAKDPPESADTKPTTPMIHPETTVVAQEVPKPEPTEAKPKVNEPKASEPKETRVPNEETKPVPASAPAPVIVEEKEKPTPPAVSTETKVTEPVRPPAKGSSSSAFTFLVGQIFGMVLVAAIWALEPDLLVRLFPSANAPSAMVAQAQPTKTTPNSPLPTQSTLPALGPSITSRRATPANEDDKWSAQEIKKIAASRPALKPWITKVQDGTWGECRDLVTGRLSTAFPSQDDYNGFLRWLILDPSKNAETRRAVPRLYVQSASLPELLDLCEHLNYPDSPRAADVQTMAQIGLDIHTTLISAADRARLKKLAGEK